MRAASGNTSSDITNHWETDNSFVYWYENGVRQGTSQDPKDVVYGGTPRGREIADSGAWYWLDADHNGAKAVNKEVFMPYIYQDEKTRSDAELRELAKLSDPGMEDFVYQSMKNRTGKWVRYDRNGQMLKGWVTISGDLAKLYPDQAGNTYYYDNKTGLMAKGTIVLNGTTYHFDDITGALK